MSCDFFLLPRSCSTDRRPWAVKNEFVFLCHSSRIFAVECYRLLETSTPRDSWHSVSRAVLRSFLEVYGIFVFGSGLSQVTVDMGKLTVGRLRPHFLTVCQPDNLDQLCPSDTAHTYITDIHCTGSPGTVEEGRLSFPSGHAAVSFYAAIYVVLFGSKQKLQTDFTLCLKLFNWLTSVGRLTMWKVDEVIAAAGACLLHFGHPNSTKNILDKTVATSKYQI
ncbi:hypothetical protein J6590_031013 [Homalodisca vitripennis]|nr:hypothetical protein J6590_031013 [Homalodisca vitripennis]